MRRIPYALVVVNLMYVMLCTRPEICYVVGIDSGYLSKLGLDYMLMYEAKDLTLISKTIRILGNSRRDQSSP